MQLNATLIAAQQAARQARFQAAHVQGPAQPAPAFAAALEKTEGFTPLPLKQAATAAPPPSRPQPQGTRPGSLLDIKI